MLDITAAHDKVIRGRFEIHLTNKAGPPLAVSSGAFVDGNRQLCVGWNDEAGCPPGVRLWSLGDAAAHRGACLSGVWAR
ncbi:MAG: hypothetical protein ABIW82_04125 [Dokdonella sp.]